MKSKIVIGLIRAGRNNKLLKIPCTVIVAVYLFFYYLFTFIFSHMRKIAGVCAIALIFVSFSSFSSAENKPEAEEKKVYVNTDEGSFEVEYIDAGMDVTSPESGSRELEVSANDLLAAMNASLDMDNEIINDFQADEEAKIYDEDKGYVRASYADDWSLILINKEHHIPVDYDLQLETIRGNVQSDVRVIPHVLDMINGAKEDGVTLYICSPYRSDERQEILFERKKKSYMRKGYSEKEAYNLASQTIAIPGTSEHQVGLAFDFISNEYKYLDAGFADTRAGRWLKEHSAEYGFILRYPSGKENITGIEFEPWHYRYVGEAAHEIMERGITLEEYTKEIGAVE